MIVEFSISLESRSCAKYFRLVRIKIGANLGKLSGFAFRYSYYFTYLEIFVLSEVDFMVSFESAERGEQNGVDFITCYHSNISSWKMSLSSVLAPGNVAQLHYEFGTN